MCVEMQFLIEL